MTQAYSAKQSKLRPTSNKRNLVNMETGMKTVTISSVRASLLEVKISR